MAGNDIIRNIVLNGKVGSGFEAIGNTLMQMGAELETVSNKIINFGKESVDVYKNYEYNLGQVEFALQSRFKEGSDEIKAQVTNIGNAVQGWAKSTIFTVEDVSNAAAIAARSGLNFEEIYASFPSVMALAQAGGMDLSSTLNMLIQSMKALGLSGPALIENVSEFADLWAYAANSSTGTVQSFGETMTHLGSVMQFSDSNAELFAMIGLMHDFGTTGSQAATMIRTSIMRLIAPSQVTGTVIEALNANLEEMGREFGSTWDNAEKLRTFEWLGNNGFSAFDENGRMKSVLDIYISLIGALEKIAGSKEAIGENQTTLGILGTLFGNRGITGAMNFINGIDQAIALRDRLLGGNAEGYAEAGQRLISDTLYGSEKALESKTQELQRRTGEVIAPQLQQVYSMLGSIADTLSGLDEGSFNAIVKGAETLAGLSIGLTATGLAFKFIGSMLTPAGAVAVGLGLVATTAAAISEMESVTFANGFGFGDLDETAIVGYVNNLTTNFQAVYTEIDQFRTKVNEAKTDYENASATFSTSLLSIAVTSNTMTESDLATLEGLGTQMYMAVQAGINNAKLGSQAYWEVLFGGTENENYQLAEQLINSGYKETLEAAAGVNQQIHDLLMKGFQEGFTEEDYQMMLSYMREYNRMVARAMADAQSEEDYIKAQKLLHKAQTADLDEVIKIAGEIATERDTAVANEEDRYLTELFRLQYAYEHQTGENPITEAQYNALVADATARHEQRLTDYTALVNETLDSLWNTQIQESDYARSFNRLSYLAEEVYAGRIGFQDAVRQWGNDLGNLKDRNSLQRTLGLMLEPYGGTGGALSEVERLRKSGYKEQADNLYKLITMSFLATGNHFGLQVNRNSGILGWLSGDYSVRPESTNYLAEYEALSPAGLLARGRELAQQFVVAQGYLNEIGEGADLFDKNLYIPDYTEQRNNALSGLQSIFTELQSSGFIDEGIDFDVNAILNAKEVQEYTPESKDAYVFYHAILLPMGLTNDGLDGSFGGSLDKFAEGGRATQASIFGEGDTAEWAIPEAHTERTAELLNAARAASGFTWPDLIERFGGLNADANHAPMTLVYSPTINANDASGVRDALEDDKRRLERWLEQRKLRDSIEVYA